MKRTLLFAVVVLIVSTIYGQENFNPNSVRPVDNSQIMWKKEYTRVIDMREKYNQSWMSFGNELSKQLLDGVMSGNLVAYASDSLTSTLTINQVLANLTIPGEEVELDPDFPEDEFPEDDFPMDTSFEEETELVSPYFFPNQLYIVELTEDAIYDKKESRIKYDIQSITLYVPADLPDNQKGVQLPILTLKYADCVKYFDSKNEWVWFNRANTQEHRTFSQAFDLRLFNSTIVKVANPDDLYVADQYNSLEQGILGSQQEAFKLMEFEHNLYEY